MKKILRPLFLLAFVTLFWGCAGNFRPDDPSPRSSAMNAQSPIEVLRLQWRKSLASREFLDYKPQEWATAVIDEKGTIYIGSSDKKFYALKPDGKVLWSLSTMGTIASQPWLNPQTKIIYFGADDGKFYAIDTVAGKIKWTYATEGVIHPAPVFLDGIVFFTTSENRIYALNASTGKWRWQYERDMPEGFTIHGYAGVAVSHGVMYSGFADGTLVALRAFSGEVIWTRSLTEEKAQFRDVDTTPIIMGSTLFAASYSGGIYALSLETGSTQWKYPIEGASGILHHGNRLYVTAPQTGVVCLDLKGHLLWRQAIPKGVPAPPTAYGPYLFITSTETGLYIASATTGELLQYFDPGQGFSAIPTFGPSNTLAILSNQGQLYLFKILLNPRA